MANVIKVWAFLLATVPYVTPASHVMKCPFPSELLHGELEFNGRVPGHKLSYTCDEGFWLRGRAERICQPDGVWSGLKPTCRVVKCPFLLDPLNGIIGYSKGQDYKDTLTVECSPGYIYTEKLPRTCLSNNQWSGRGGQCIHKLTAICPTPELPEHGMLNMTGKKYNDTITVTCTDGYHYNGSSVRVCQGDGHWSGTNGFCEQKVQNLDSYSSMVTAVVVSILILLLICLIGGLICRYFYTKRRERNRTTVTKIGEQPRDGPAPPVSVGQEMQEKEPLLSDGKQDVQEEDRTLIQDLEIDKVILLLDVGRNVKTEVLERNGPGEKIKHLLRELGSDRKSLYNAIAAVQPELFKKIHGREPSQEERDACVLPTITKLRGEMEREKHKPDAEFDKEVNFDANFIHLVFLNNSRRGNTDDKFTIEDILTKKRTNDPVEESGKKCIILKGRAGVGKTTLLQYLCRRWAKGKWGQQFAVIFLLKMRVVMMIKEKLITLTELLTNHSQFGSDKTMLSSWIPSNLDRIGIIIDCINELPNVADGIRDTGKITSWDDREDPVKLCFSVMKGHLMGRSTRIITSRPFINLHKLEHDRLIEIYGLKDEQIHEYIDKNVDGPSRERVRSMLTGVPHLMSLCQITFYCMAFCRIFGEGDVDADELNTYTSIMAFVVLHYACRREHPEIQDLPVIVKEAKSFLPQLAKLAFQGLKASGGVKIVFTDEDLTAEDKGQLEKTGLIRSETLSHNTGQTESISEFIHLSIQEFLGMAEISNRSDDVKSLLKKDTTDNESTLTKQFLFGLVFDTKNKWINAVKKALGWDETYDTEVREVAQKHVKALADYLRVAGEFSTRLEFGILKPFLLAYESQSEDLAKEVCAVPASQNGKLKLEKISFTAIDMKALTFVLDKGIALTCLQLHQCNLDEACLQILAKYMEGKKCPTELSFATNNLGPEGAAHLSTALKENNTLTTLSLNGNNLGPQGAAHLSTALKENKTLTTLNLYYNHLGSEGAAHLSTALKENNTLTSLDLNDNNLGPEGAAVLSTALKENKTLTSLELYDNKLGSEGAAHLSTALKVNNTLTTLSLYNNNIGPEGAAHLSTALKENKTLTTLSLGSNKLGPEGAAHLSTALKENKTLTTLNLGSNKLGPEGAAHLSTALKENKTLTTLKLKYNQIGDEGALHWSEALKCNKSITELDLEGNEIGDEGALHLSEALKCNKSITKLELGGNDISDSGRRTLDNSKGPLLEISYSY